MMPVFTGKNQNKEICKRRIAVLTDVSTWETDNSESLVRLLVHADLFEIQGIIYTTGWNHEVLGDDFIDLIHDAIDAYEKDLPNLMKHSNQVGLNQDELQQTIGYWPSPEYLHQRTVLGVSRGELIKLEKTTIPTETCF